MGTRRAGLAAAMLALAITATGCTASGGMPPRPAPTSASPAVPIAVVALGDSDTTGVGDPTGRGWVRRYASLVERELGRRVVADNRAVEGKTSEQLRSEVEQDTALRKALAGADVILLGIGGADLNAGDDAFGAGRCTGRRCYAGPLRDFDRNVGAVASEVRRLAPDAVLLAITLPNALPGAREVVPSVITADISRYQVETERDSVCRAMQANHGRCVDVARAFNGPGLDADAYAAGLMTKDPCCYASGKGQQRIAELLLAAGLPDASS